MEYEGENCYIPNGNACFLKLNNYIYKKDFYSEYFEFIQSYKRRTNVMTRCKIPEFCERHKMDIGIYDPKAKDHSLEMLKRGTYVYTFIKVNFV